MIEKAEMEAEGLLKHWIGLKILLTGLKVVLNGSVGWTLELVSGTKNRLRRL